MQPLNGDDTFHFEALRVLGSARYYGADIGEVLDTLQKIAPGNFESWHTHFNALAHRVCSRLHRGEFASAASVRDTMFHAASYFRAADFFLHGDKEDPRIDELWKKQRMCFDRAIAALPIPGQRITIQADGFTVPAVFYRATEDGTGRPTVLMCNGYDGSQEEMLHTNGFAALERGFHVLTFEGPGQPTPRREQNLGFIPEWERVVGPVLDFCQTRSEIDMARIGLLGYSMGAILVARAAAFEDRIAAVMCVDGIYDLYDSFSGALPPNMKELLQHGSEAEFNGAIRRMMTTSARMRWAVEQGLWSFNVDSPYLLLERARAWTLKDLVCSITVPVLVCDAENDRFFDGQPKQLADSLGTRATYLRFREEDSTGEHCHVGASALMNHLVMDWYENLVTARECRALHPGTFERVRSQVRNALLA